MILKVSNVSKWKPVGVSPDALTAINTEWGCYGSKLLPRCQEDAELDAASGAQKGSFHFFHASAGLAPLASVGNAMVKVQVGLWIFELWTCMLGGVH
jgi:hypothetical protein